MHWKKILRTGEVVGADPSQLGVFVFAIPSVRGPYSILRVPGPSGSGAHFWQISERLNIFPCELEACIFASFDLDD